MIAIVWVVALGIAPGCIPIPIPKAGPIKGGVYFAVVSGYDAVDQPEVDRAAEVKRERENAEIRATGEMLAREATRAPEPSNLDPNLPWRLDPAMISEAVTKVTPRVMSCRDPSLAKGRIVVSVKVAADGHVRGVTIDSALPPGLGSCVAAAIETAMFANTQHGGSFRYPFVL